MVCRYCNKPISFLRSLIDNQFCSKKHRSAFSVRSARALRDMGEIAYSTADLLHDGDDLEIPKQRRRQRNGSSAGAALGLALLALAGLFVLDRLGGPGGAAPKKVERDGEPGPVEVLLGKVMDRLPKMSRGIRLEERFDSGLRSWVPAPGASSGTWRVENGLIHPGALRIWDASRKLGDYSFQFQARVESKSVGWVVRAPDHSNYHAAKIVLEGAGRPVRPELVRFSVVRGKETRRQHFPLPFALDTASFYDYEVRAMGDRIVTLVGGRVIDQWRDSRFRTGGVGFFSERGELASVRWAKVQEGESLADRLRGYLTFGLVIPEI